MKSLVSALSPRVFLRSGYLGELPPGAIVLDQVPSAAFGDGSHPTTRLCATAVDFVCRTRPCEAMLDVGTGTGVLARIARARGARFVAATDIDPEALEAARANCALDGHPVPIDVSSRAPDAWGARFDLVVANILEGPLTELAPALTRALRPGGMLLISGFTAMQLPFLRERFEAAGLSYVTEATLDGWMVVTFGR